MRRVAHGRIAKAVGRLRDEDADPAEAVHGARKDLKKLRSSLRLVRQALGASATGARTAAFVTPPGCSRTPATPRSAPAPSTRSPSPYADEPPPGGWSALKAQLAHGHEQRDGDLGALRERAAAAVAAGDGEVDDWPLDGDGFELLEPGLRRAYKRGRRALARARAEPTDEPLHEFRKRSKDLWYHLRLLRNGWKQVLEATADEAHELSDRLGDDHDLALLAADLERGEEPITIDQRAHLQRLISRRRGSSRPMPSPSASGFTRRSRNGSRSGSKATGTEFP